MIGCNILHLIFNSFQHFIIKILKYQIYAKNQGIKVKKKPWYNLVRKNFDVGLKYCMSFGITPKMSKIKKVSVILTA